MTFGKDYKWLKVIGHIVFWLCSFAFAFFAYYVATDSKIGITPIAIIRATFLNFGFALAVYINLLILIPRFFKANNYIFYTFWLLVTLAISSVTIKLLLHFTLDVELTRRMYSSFFFTSAMYVGLTSLLKFAKDWLVFQDMSLKFHKIEREKLEAELNILKSQINPHFLFNCLNNIYSLSLINSKKTPEMILKLSDLMRHVLYESRENFIPLKKEIEFVNNFIELQRIRLNEKVNIDFTINGTVNNKLIIPLIFEPFIDNAFKHGCYSNTDSAFIRILIHIENEHLNFIISNTFDPESQNDKTKDKASGIGMENARRRLEYLYKKDEFKLDISKKENIFKVELKLSLKDK